jgi:hypothetical protein
MEAEESKKLISNEHVDQGMAVKLQAWTKHTLLRSLQTGTGAHPAPISWRLKVISWA